MENIINYFEVTISQVNIRMFSTSLHLLQKVGKDITFDVEDSTLTLRALNDLKSSFASVEFNENFFERFSISDTYRSFSCRLAVKPICAIFRNIKNVRSIRLAANMIGPEHELTFEMLLSSGITRTHRFHYCDCEIMNALFEEGDCSFARIKPKVFAQILEHLHQSPEVSVETSASTFSVRSFHKSNFGTTSLTLQQQQQELKRHMNTGLSVSIQEFEMYQFKSFSGDGCHDPDEVVELIFCLREVTAFLGFCEALDLPDFDFFFSQGGRAIKFSCKYDEHVTVALVLATIESHTNKLLNQQGGGAQYAQQSQRQQQSSHHSGAAADQSYSYSVDHQQLDQSDAVYTEGPSEVIYGDDIREGQHYQHRDRHQQERQQEQQRNQSQYEHVQHDVEMTSSSRPVSSNINAPLVVTNKNDMMLQSSMNTSDSTGTSGSGAVIKPGKASNNRRKRLLDESSDDDE